MSMRFRVIVELRPERIRRRMFNHLREDSGVITKLMGSKNPGFGIRILGFRNLDRVTSISKPGGEETKERRPHITMKSTW